MPPENPEKPPKSKRDKPDVELTQEAVREDLENLAERKLMENDPQPRKHKGRGEPWPLTTEETARQIGREWQKFQDSDSD